VLDFPCAHALRKCAKTAQYLLDTLFQVARYEAPNESEFGSTEQSDIRNSLHLSVLAFSTGKRNPSALLRQLTAGS